MMIGMMSDSGRSEFERTSPDDDRDAFDPSIDPDPDTALDPGLPAMSPRASYQSPPTPPSPPPGITPEQIRHLFTQLADLMTTLAPILQAMGSGQVPMPFVGVGDAFGMRTTLDGISPEQLRERHANEGSMQYRPTLKELRAAGQLPTGEALINLAAPRPRKVRASSHAPRRGYVVVDPNGGQLDLRDLTPGAMAIMKFVAINGNTTIKQLIEATNLKRSTIANTLTILRARGLVKSEQL